MRGLRWGVRALGEVLITFGLLLFLFVAWQLWWTDVTANRAQANTIQALEKGFGPAGLPERRAGEPLATLTKVPLGQAFAIVRIPRFGADYARPVLEGTDRDTLTKGMGHYSGTAFPGQIGNFALAGHRTTYGRPLHTIDLLQKGDVIVVETKASYIVYAVDRHVIVTPNKVEVIAPVPQRPGARPTQAWLTMTACHPKDAGHAGQPIGSWGMPSARIPQLSAACPKIIRYHHDPRHQSVVVRIVPPAATNPPKAYPSTESP